jgi:hypothetical protein
VSISICANASDCQCEGLYRTRGLRNGVRLYLESNYLTTLQWPITGQAVCRRLPTATALVLTRSGHVGFVVDRVAGLLRVLRFPLPTIPPTVPPSSPSSITGGCYNRPNSCDVPRGLSLTSPQQTKLKKKLSTLYGAMIHMLSFHHHGSSSLPLLLRILLSISSAIFDPSLHRDVTECLGTPGIC